MHPGPRGPGRRGASRTTHCSPFFPSCISPRHECPGVHPTARLGRGVQFPADATIDAYAVIGDGVRDRCACVDRLALRDRRRRHDRRRRAAAPHGDALQRHAARDTAWPSTRGRDSAAMASATSSARGAHAKIPARRALPDRRRCRDRRQHHDRPGERRRHGDRRRHQDRQPGAHRAQRAGWAACV